MKNRLLFILLLCLSGCSTLQEWEQYIPQDNAQIVEAQTLLSSKRVNGVYQLDIKAGHRQGQFVYLNTRSDNRDPKNISIAIAPDIAVQLAEQYARSPEAFFINKTIRVNGEARQVKMWEYDNGRRTDRYFYQTRIKISDVAQISL